MKTVVLFKIWILLFGLVALSGEKVKVHHIKPELHTRGIQWQELEQGLFYVELNAPQKSKINDSKLSILKIDPTYFSFELLTASEHDSLRRTVEKWSNDFDLVAVVNAGMFNLANHITSTGYMCNYSHENNPKLRENFRAMAMFNPKSKDYPAMNIVDMEIENWEEIRKNYNSVFQCIRMIDCNQKQVLWKPRIPISSSMCVLATDINGNILFIFSRSPYTANQMSIMLLSLHLHIYSAMYLEGGPEASLYISVGDTIIEKVGSWVSRTYPTDKNDYFWELPNVIGVKRKIK